MKSAQQQQINNNPALGESFNTECINDIFTRLATATTVELLLQKFCEHSVDSYMPAQQLTRSMYVRDSLLKVLINLDKLEL